MAPIPAIFYEMNFATVLLLLVSVLYSVVVNIAFKDTPKVVCYHN